MLSWCRSVGIASSRCRVGPLCLGRWTIDSSTPAKGGRRKEFTRQSRLKQRPTATLHSDRGDVAGTLYEGICIQSAGLKEQSRYTAQMSLVTMRLQCQLALFSCLSRENGHVHCKVGKRFKTSTSRVHPHLRLAIQTSCAREMCDPLPSSQCNPCALTWIVAKEALSLIRSAVYPAYSKQPTTHAASPS